MSGSSFTIFLCPYCDEKYSAPSETRLLTHIRLAHANDPNFSIQYSSSGCARTFTTFYTTKMFYHMYFFFQFVESEFELRSDAKHSYHCDVLERSDLSAADQQHFSLVYGVNRRALLNTGFL